MRIVHLNKNDLSGGAARAAYRLHKGLQSIGHESLMLVVMRGADDSSVIAVERPMDLMSRARRGLREYWIAQQFRRYSNTRPSGYELFSDDRNEYTSTLLSQIPPCDVVNLHWVAGFVDYTGFLSRIPQFKPVVWTLHDMNPFTGGCHYDMGCQRYLNHCGACPQLGSRQEHDLSHQIWLRKRNAFSRVDSSRLRIVTPSKWLGEEAKRSPIFGRFPVSVIPYGLNTDDFAPKNKAAVRELLGISRSANVVLFVADEIDNKRKGFALLAEALAACARTVPNLMLVSLGSKQPDLKQNIPWLHVGSVSNDRFLSMVYSAADLFAICSLQDNLPNTVLEAMACGIPTVGVNVGGISDMVRQGVNGLTVQSADADALSRAISDLLNARETLEEMRANCRRIAVEEYSLDLQAQRYFNLYSRMVSEEGSLPLSEAGREKVAGKADKRSHLTRRNPLTSHHQASIS